MLPTQNMYEGVFRFKRGTISFFIPLPLLPRLLYIKQSVPESTRSKYLHVREVGDRKENDVEEKRGKNIKGWEHKGVNDI